MCIYTAFILQRANTFTFAPSPSGSQSVLVATWRQDNIHTTTAHYPVGINTTPIVTHVANTTDLCLKVSPIFRKCERVTRTTEPDTSFLVT